MDVTEQSQLSHHQAVHHWYYRSQFNLMVRLIESLPLDRGTLRLADFGCGLGLYLSMLEELGILRPDQLCGIDPAYPKNTKVRGGTVAIFPQFPQDGSYDVILLTHVLEHIADDAAALKMVSSYCKTSGYLLISVPALQFLWSNHDTFLGHHRRYNKNSLVRLIETEPSLELQQIHYYFASILPIGILVRGMSRFRKPRSGSDLKPVLPLVNELLLGLLNFENKWASYNRIAGMSLVAVCEKK
jgi:2-polyprenyl-3-methyl-5-hydroxy-6-metoxy-1,4-benzoquinol methylase